LIERFIDCELQRYLGLVKGSIGGAYNGTHITCTYNRLITVDSGHIESDKVLNLSTPCYVMLSRGPTNERGNMFLISYLCILHCCYWSHYCFYASRWSFCIWICLLWLLQLKVEHNISDISLCTTVDISFRKALHNVYVLLLCCAYFVTLDFSQILSAIILSHLLLQITVIFRKSVGHYVFLYFHTKTFWFWWRCFGFNVALHD